MSCVTRWKMLENYVGAVWPNYYRSGVGQNRDSDTLTRSNFAVASEALLALSTDDAPVQIVREGHWAVGWIEWVAIHEDNTDALKAAERIHERLESYPVLDEDHFSALECSEAEEAWANSLLKERIQLCVDAGVSVFAARREYPPSDDSGYIQERLLGY